MRTFKVVLKAQSYPNNSGMTSGNHTVFIKSDDVNTEIAGSVVSADEDTGIYFNFWVQPEGKDAYTVAMVPFDNVLFIADEANLNP